MSLRAVELQITIPRTQDAGRIQEQLQQRPQIDQTHLMNEQKKELDKQLQKTKQSEKTEKENIKNQEKKHSKNQQNQQNAKKGAEKKKKEVKHPFKGHSVDISL